VQNFNRTIQDKLGFYVYGLIDPITKEIFYVGKASGNNRAFDHLKKTQNMNSRMSPKKLKINEIRQKGYEPIVEVLRYGLSSEEVALEVEAAIIDSIGLEKLTNIVKGHGIERGRLTLQEIERLYGSTPVNITTLTEKYVMFFLSQTYSTSLDEIQIYDATRQFWYNVSQVKRNKNERGELEYSVALSIYDSVVVRVYSILQWFRAGQTLSTRSIEKTTDRWEFVGNLILDHPLMGKKLVEDANGSDLRANQQGYRYVN